MILLPGRHLHLRPTVEAVAALWIGLAVSVGCDGSFGSPHEHVGDVTGQKSDTTATPDVGEDAHEGWTRLLGSAASDHVRDVVADAKGNVYLAGSTRGDMKAGGTSHQGGSDAFVAKYDADGKHLWTRLLGGDADEEAWSVAVHHKGRLYLAGSTTGPFGEETFHGGKKDGFVAAFRPDGDLRWLRLLGTTKKDLINRVIPSAEGGLFLAGSIGKSREHPDHNGGQDAFVAKYGPDGEKKWGRLIGTAGNDWAVDVARGPSRHIYVVGRVDEALPGTDFRGGSFDGFLASYRPDGRRRWVRTFGTPGWDDAQGVATDSRGYVYVTGWTRRKFEAQAYRGGWSDAFLVKFDAKGQRRWARLLGGPSKDVARCVVTDESDRIHVAGHTTEAFGGSRRDIGWAEAFVGSFSPDGESLRMRHWGGPGGELVSGLAVPDANRMFLAGLIDETVGEQTYHGGSFDGFVARLPRKTDRPGR